MQYMNFWRTRVLDGDIRALDLFVFLAVLSSKPDMHGSLGQTMGVRMFCRPFGITRISQSFFLRGLIRVLAMGKLSMLLRAVLLFTFLAFLHYEIKLTSLTSTNSQKKAAVSIIGGFPVEIPSLKWFKHYRDVKLKR